MADEITFDEMWEQLKSESPENRKMLEEVEVKARAMMADTRGKLIELLTAYFGVDPAYYGIEAQHLADNLIANGVTFATDNNVGGKWISVEDRLPDETKDEHVLVVCDYHGKITVGTRKMWHIDSAVTHWMPLPEPPDMRGDA